MALVDPYSPCPCGSGQKFKWCCQKVEAVAERVQRLWRSGQAQAAIEALDEGLQKEPGSAWLVTMKAMLLASLDKRKESAELLRNLLRKQPKLVSAQILLLQLVLEGEEAVAAAAQLQQVLEVVDAPERSDLASLINALATRLADAGLFPAALKHFELEQQLAPADGAPANSSVRMIEANPAVSAWQKHDYRLAEPPPDLPAKPRALFAQALSLCDAGRWRAAAGLFEQLASDRLASPVASRNLGLCRLWVGDRAGAVTALRRSIANPGADPQARADAVDIEALCQQVAPAGPDDQVELVQWIWPLRNRERLLEILGTNPLVLADGSGPIDPSDPESPEVEQFELLDKPRVEPSIGLTRDQIPSILAKLMVGREIVALEGFDDGRLDGLAERLTSQAGTAIAPAHPKIKVLGTTPRSMIALAWEWATPPGMPAEQLERLQREHGAYVVREVWPNTPMPYLRGRTPLAAAAAGDAEIPLRAAVVQLEQSNEPWCPDIDFPALRGRLKLGPEPPIDSDAVDLEHLHLSRLALVPIERLSDERLLVLYRRAKRTMQIDALRRATRLLIDRPGIAERGGIESLELYSGLAAIESEHGSLSEAFALIGRGRQADPTAVRAKNAPFWDMLEIRFRARSETPQTWVPALAVVLNRYRNDQTANETVVMALIDMGLMRLVANAERPDQVMIDPRPLQMLMAEYGPRVTTASGELGAGAGRGEIWTPGGPSGAASIWTPGSGPAPAATAPGGEKPKLIIPGR